MAEVFVVVMVALSVPIIVTVTDGESAVCAEIPPPDQGGEGAQCELKFHCLLYVLLYEVTNRLSFFVCQFRAGYIVFLAQGRYLSVCVFTKFGTKV